MRILTSDEVRGAEREATDRPGMSTQILMHRAGTAVSQFCVSHFKFNSLCVVCGKGNNGGVGLVAAETLHQVTGNVSVVILASDVHALSADAAAMCSRLPVEPMWISDPAGFESEPVRQALAADLIIDAIFGTGFKPPLLDLPRRAVEAINDAFGTVVSVDLPSGVDGDTNGPVHESSADIVFAHGIVTFVAPKPAHVFGELTSGPIAVSEIGVPPPSSRNTPATQAITAQEVGITFPPQPNNSYKGQAGHVLVIGGSLGKAGAAALSGMAALSSGAGLVTVACPKSIQATVACFAAEIMTEGLPETDEGSVAMAATGKMERLLAGKDAVVLGPGLSGNPVSEEFVRWLVARCPLPLVLDADALNAFDGDYDDLKAHEHAAPFRVLIPHAGEAARWLDTSIPEKEASRLEMARRISRETSSCVVLKGWRTIVAGLSGEAWINMAGNPTLAKAGSGEVLSGMIAAGLSRQAATAAEFQTPGGGPDLQPKSWMHEIYGIDSRDKLWKRQLQDLQRDSQLVSSFLKDVSVAAAVHLHGLAGQFADDMFHKNTVLAGNLIRLLAEAFRDCDQQMERELFYLQK